MEKIVVQITAKQEAMVECDHCQGSGVYPVSWYHSWRQHKVARVYAVPCYMCHGSGERLESNQSGGGDPFKARRRKLNVTHLLIENPHDVKAMTGLDYREQSYKSWLRHKKVLVKGEPARYTDTIFDQIDLTVH